MNLRRLIPLAEVGLFYALALWIIWGAGKFRPTILIVALLMVALCVASNKFHGDSLARIGLKKENFWPSAKLVFPSTLPLLLPLIVLAVLKFDQPKTWDLWFSLLGYPIWGFAQEYALLGFVANRLEDAWPERHTLIAWLNGFLFALAHFPNPVLMSATFVAGTLFTMLFFRRRHLVPIAIVHALFGIFISLAWGDVRGVMSVGPGYISRVGTSIMQP